MRHLVRLVRLAFERAPLAFVLGLLASLATALAGIALLGVAGWFITASALAGIAGAGLMFEFFRPSASIRGLAVLRTFGRYGERLITHETTLNFIVGIRERLFYSFARADFGKLARLRSGEMLARLTSDADNLDGLYLRGLLPAFTAVVGLAAIALSLMYVSPLVALGFVGVLALAVLVAVLLVLRAAPRDARLATLALESLRLRAIDLVRGQAELLLAGRLEAHSKTVLDADRRRHLSANRLNLIEIAGNAASLLGAQASILVALLLGASALHQGKIDAPGVVVFVLVAIGASELTAPLVAAALGTGRTLLAARRIAPRLSEPGLIAADPVEFGQPAAEPGMPILQISGLSGRSGQAVDLAVRDFSLAVAARERVALVGPSGSGKSTLLGLIAGTQVVEGGMVLLGGIDVSGMLDGVLREQMVLLPQKSAVFAGSVSDNLRLAQPRATDTELWAALDVAQLAEFIRTLPDGLEHKLQEGGKGLSGGQRRRLALARAVLRRPPVLLMDEPTEGMQEELGLAVLSAVFAALPETAIVFATHRKSEERLANRVIDLAPAGDVTSDRGAITIPI